MVSWGRYLIGSPEANKMPLPRKTVQQWRCHYYFATERRRCELNEAKWH